MNDPVKPITVAIMRSHIIDPFASIMPGKNLLSTIRSPERTIIMAILVAIKKKNLLI